MNDEQAKIIGELTKADAIKLYNAGPRDIPGFVNYRGGCARESVVVERLFPRHPAASKIRKFSSQTATSPCESS